MFTLASYFSTSVLLFSLVCQYNVIYTILLYFNKNSVHVYVFVRYIHAALPFLGNTQVYLWYPIVATGFLWLLSITLLALGLKVNLTHIVMGFHYGNSSGSESGGGL